MSTGTAAATVVVGVQLETTSGTLSRKAEQSVWKFSPVMVTVTVSVLTIVLGRIAWTIGRTSVGVGVGGGAGVSVGTAVGAGTGVSVGVTVEVGIGVSVGAGVEVGTGVLVGASVEVGAWVAVAVEVGGATVNVAIGGGLVGVGKSVAVGIGLGGGAGPLVATRAGVGDGVGVSVTVGVGGKRTIPAGVALETGVRASRATSVAASMPTAGSRGANGVSSLDRRR